jgi:hypothetical protein
MRWISAISFFMLIAIAGVNIFYIFIRGMAPGASSLKLSFTRFFVYEPGLGFLWLIILWIVTLILKAAASQVKNSTTRILLERISWATLILLLAIEGAIFADFSRLI